MNNIEGLGSGGIRSIGKASTEQKSEAVREVVNAREAHYGRLSEKQVAIVKKWEHPKGPLEAELLHLADDEVSKLMEQAGVTPFEIPPENAHLLPNELYEVVLGTEGAAQSNAYGYAPDQVLYLRAEDFAHNPVYLASVAFHELMHLKAHLTLEVNELDDGYVAVTPYRESVAVRAPQREGMNGNYYEFFRGLHEAIVSRAQKEMHLTLLENPALFEQKNWLQSETARHARTNISMNKGIPEDEILWVDKDNQEKYITFSYVDERKILSYVCEEIARDNPERFPDERAVFNEFLKAHFNGNLLTIGRLVEHAFGKGAFRLLGSMSTKEGEVSAQQCLERLKTMRESKYDI